MKFLYLLVGIIAGTLILIYTPNFVKIFGRMDWAERRFGPAGTYTAWRLGGLFCFVAGVVFYLGLV